MILIEPNGGKAIIVSKKPPSTSTVALKYSAKIVLDFVTDRRQMAFLGISGLQGKPVDAKVI